MSLLIQLTFKQMLYVCSTAATTVQQPQQQRQQQIIMVLTSLHANPLEN